MTLSPLGDSAVVLTLGSGLDEAVLLRVRAVADAIERDLPSGALEVVAAFASVTVYFELGHAGSYTQWCEEIAVRAERADAGGVVQRGRVIEIPVCYGGEGGPDLAEVAARAGVSVDEVVQLHAGGDYGVHAIGFAPGFAYLGGLATKLHTPRRATPRTAVAAGTVGIGGAQTGVYPLATPGGWNLIGRTPLRLFEAGRAEPALLRAGDRVTFRAISAEEFATWR